MVLLAVVDQVASVEAAPVAASCWLGDNTGGLLVARCDGVVAAAKLDALNVDVSPPPPSDAIAGGGWPVTGVAGCAANT